MAEIPLVPTAMAIDAFIAESADFPACRMTGATTQSLVKPIQSPATISGMCEGWLFPGVVALVTRVV